MQRRAFFLAAAATMAAVLVPSPADAAKPGDWTRIELPCRDGRGVAVIGFSPTHPWWGPVDEAGSAFLNPKPWASWYQNARKGQWLLTGRWTGEPSPSSNVMSTSPVLCGECAEGQGDRQEASYLALVTRRLGRPRILSEESEAPPGRPGCR